MFKTRRSDVSVLYGTTLFTDEDCILVKCCWCTVKLVLQLQSVCLCEITPRGSAIIQRWLSSIRPQVWRHVGAVRGDACWPGGQRPADQTRHEPRAGADVQREAQQAAAVHHQRQPPPADPGELSRTSGTNHFSTWTVNLQKTSIFRELRRLLYFGLKQFVLWH